MGWSESSSNGYVLVINDGLPGSLTPHSGAWLAWLGGDDLEESVLEQQVTVSPSQVHLIYWVWVASQDMCLNDVGGIAIGDAVVDAYFLCSDNSTGGWIRRSVDLSDYAGQSVLLVIAAFTDSLLNSNMFVDDFAFSASALASDGNLIAPSDLGLLARRLER